ncbi:hypothetical protein ETAA8_47830 [Anatilimnocola aggregata]|uniref:methanethiol S-methyltransferase n=1 Tax=Anatilimnocola aggregata TaxID=2528021 RepID=A0A517YHG9_9BACT|nr:methanethiol S-methyltransferase [Anatilimnocola aggregata]QDU29668.1 hypothetical protein ETAA8_47830 [Anatilimnocola aggregata]
MSRYAALIYGLACYALFGVVSIWALAFLGNFLPADSAFGSSIDSPARGWWPAALAVNALLLTMFAVQHSVMARPWFKRRWTKLIPEPVERSTYVLFSCIALGLVVWLWQPIGGIVWQVNSPALRAAIYALYFAGWLTIVASSFFINHFDLFGLRQVWLYYQGLPYTHLPFATPGPYRFIRHPLYVGWLLTFWAAPTMTYSHLFFALGTTAYIFIAVIFEERDLIAHFGERYAEYRRSTPMLVPALRTNSSRTEKAVTE